MELATVNNINHKPLNSVLPTMEKASPFIEANTEKATLLQLQQECTIPVFAKDNEVAISHQDFIEAMQECVEMAFGNETISEPDIRVSHVIKGRIPEAIRKPAQELLPFEKTMYWERMAFFIEIPSVLLSIVGNPITLSIGGVRAFNHQNLYGKKSIEKFKIFIGFKNSVCTNMCISTDGLATDVRASNVSELKQQIMRLISNYNMQNHFKCMQGLESQYLTEKQFCQILGRGRLYQHLPKNIKDVIPDLQFNDGQLNAITKAYFEDENFSREGNGDVSLWNMYNLFTGANKSSYIDTFLDRGLNAFEFSQGVSKALSGDSRYSWFLS